MHVSVTVAPEALAGLEEPKRSTLQQLRQTILAIVPKAKKCIPVRMQSFRFEGTVIAGFAAFKNHLSYLVSQRIGAWRVPRRAGGPEGMAGSLHFPIDQPLHAAIVRKLIAVRFE